MIERSFNNLQLRTSEARSLSAHPSAGELTGYASVYNSLSQDLGGFKEKVSSTAFTKSLKNNNDVRGLINHDPSLLIGRVSNKTLRLSSDSRGLRSDFTLPNTSYAKDLYASVSRGDLTSMSFAFVVDPQGDSWDEEFDEESNSKIPIRTLRSVTLLDASCVTNPAYESSSVKVLPELNSYGETFDGRVLPTTIPVEFRSRIVMAHYHFQPRRRIFNLILS
jgi:HK97 family phage prohead protease